MEPCKKYLVDFGEARFQYGCLDIVSEEKGTEFQCGGVLECLQSFGLCSARKC